MGDRRGRGWIEVFSSRHRTISWEASGRVYNSARTRTRWKKASSRGDFGFIQACTRQGRSLAPSSHRRTVAAEMSSTMPSGCGSSAARVTAGKIQA